MIPALAIFADFKFDLKKQNKKFSKRGGKEIWRWLQSPFRGQYYKQIRYVIYRPDKVGLHTAVLLQS